VPFNVIKEDLIRLGFNHKKIKVIRMGVDTNRFKPLTYFKSSKEKRYVILTLIKDAKREGLDYLLQAFLRLLKKGIPVELHVGSSISYESLLKIAKRYRVPDDRLRYLGFIEDRKMPIIYNKASVFVMLQQAGFSLSILEAMACGTPVIATNTEDIREIIKDEAILVNPFNVEGISHALETILMNKGIAEELSMKGITLASKYTWKRTAIETLAVYKEVVYGEAE
jgi:glycosyltransferase involved in cell wall biosynthesis